jgi:ABC-type sugar transport system ATPase subunit
LSAWPQLNQERIVAALTTAIFLLFVAIGLAVVVISSYLPEILTLSDRILVCRKGRIVEEFARGEASEEKVMYAAVH